MDDEAAAAEARNNKAATDAFGTEAMDASGTEVMDASGTEAMEE